MTGGTSLSEGPTAAGVLLRWHVRIRGTAHGHGHDRGRGPGCRFRGRRVHAVHAVHAVHQRDRRRRCGAEEHDREGVSMNDPRAGTQAQALRPGRRRPPGHRVLHPGARPHGRRPARGLRHVRAPRQQPADGAFNETHILATTQAICDYRKGQGYDGPLFVGRDTHGLSEPAWASALEVLVANDVTVLVDDRDGYTPTPAVSHAILRANRGKAMDGPGLADGIVVTPSHNPPSRRRLQVQPAARRPGRHRCHQRRSPSAPTRSSRPASTVCAGSRSPGRGRRRGPTTSWAPTSTTCPRWSTSTASARPASASAPTRSAVPASTTGARSPSGTGST